MERNSRNRREFVTSRLRLREYDYSLPAYYFVSICCNHRESMFGTIENRKMILNPAGEMIDQIWDEAPTGFMGVTSECHVVMPNHVHILVGIGVKATDPLDLTSLTEVIHWYKSLTTTRYIRGVKDQAWPRFNGRLWQQGFHDHIVRNERELQTIREYVANNPKRWDDDTYRE